MIDMRRVGEKLHIARRRAGMTMKQVHEASGVSYNIISRLETGKRPQVTFDVVARIATVLGVSLDELVEDEEVLVG
jgi:transcriptional regulator with XRE-family HTH domain